MADRGCEGPVPMAVSRACPRCVTLCGRMCACAGAQEHGALVFESRRFVELRKQSFWRQLTSNESTGMGIFYTLNVFCIQARAFLIESGELQNFHASLMTGMRNSRFTCAPQCQCLLHPGVLLSAAELSLLCRADWFGGRSSRLICAPALSFVCSFGRAHEQCMC